MGVKIERRECKKRGLGGRRGRWSERKRKGVKIESVKKTGGQERNR